MLFSYENVLKIFEQLPYVGIRSSGIEAVSVFCNLGIFIDRNLTKKNQISNTVKTCN